MNGLSLIGYALSILGVILLITNSTKYTNINYIWIIIPLLLGFVMENKLITKKNTCYWEIVR